MAKNRGYEIEGMKELQKLLNTYGEKVFARACAQANRKAATPINKTAKALTPTQSKALKKAIGVKISNNKKRLTSTAIIGARKDKGTMYDGEYRDPWNYDHLVEDGFITADGTHYPGHKMFRRAYEQNKEAVERIHRKTLKEAVERLGKKAKKK